MSIELPTGISFAKVYVVPGATVSVNSSSSTGVYSIVKLSVALLF